MQVQSLANQPARSYPKPNHPRKGPKRASRGKFRPAVRKAIIERDNGLCVRCGRKYEEIHHITFRSQGGTGEAPNGCCICGGCHRLAHKSRKVREWFEAWQKLLYESSK